MRSASAELGVSVRALGSYERTEALPDIDFLAKFAEATGADISELIRLRLVAAGRDEAASQVGESAGNYDIHSGAVASHARQAIMQADGLPQYWQLGIMELAAAGEITSAGVDRLIEMLASQHEHG